MVVGQICLSLLLLQVVVAVRAKKQLLRDRRWGKMSNRIMECKNNGIFVWLSDKVFRIRDSGYGMTWLWYVTNRSKHLLQTQHSSSHETTDHHINTAYNIQKDLISKISHRLLIDCIMRVPLDCRIHFNFAEALEVHQAILIGSPTHLGRSECYYHRQNGGCSGFKRDACPFCPGNSNSGSCLKPQLYYLHMSWEDGVIDVLEAAVSPVVELLA